MKKKLLLGALITVIAVLLILVIATPKLELESPLPVPNGYDDFLKAMTLLEPSPPDWQGMKGEEQHTALRKLVAANQAALDLARSGLSKECRMAPYEMNATNSTHLNDLAKFKRLALAFTAASRLALIEGRTNEAAFLAVDCIRYGSESIRGGVLIDGLVGIAVRNIGLSSVKSALAGMDSETTRSALSALESVQAHSESGEEVIKREKQWARRGRFGSMGVVGQFVQPFMSRKVLAKGRQKFIQSESDIGRMQLQLATHAYQLERGNPPASMNELVPQYLKSAPVDPETGKELPFN
jgi:hypothetical protein